MASKAMKNYRERSKTRKEHSTWDSFSLQKYLNFPEKIVKMLRN